MNWFKQLTCSHEFRYENLENTGIPKPPEPRPEASFNDWMIYRQGLSKSDWHLKRVRWPCFKCGKVFEAHCGLDILRHGKIHQPAIQN